MATGRANSASWKKLAGTGLAAVGVLVAVLAWLRPQGSAQSAPPPTTSNNNSTTINVDSHVDLTNSNGSPPGSLATSAAPTDVKDSPARDTTIRKGAAETQRHSTPEPALGVVDAGAVPARDVKDFQQWAPEAQAQYREIKDAERERQKAYNYIPTSPGDAGTYAK